MVNKSILVTKTEFDLNSPNFISKRNSLDKNSSPDLKPQPNLMDIEQQKQQQQE